MNIFETLEDVAEDDVADATSRRERRREREFYKYYEPICALSPAVPALINLYDPEVRAQHVPRSSPDRALTAFCQLGALRLAARRCMLFFFDIEHAYILAEATQTLSLVDDKTHEDSDGLWLGNTIVPKSITVCQNTVNIPEANYGSNRTHSNAGLVHIINNLADNTRYCDRPFVTEGPLARFYAGVPIVTPSSYRIGAFCVLDDKPRDGLSDKDVTFLCQMGETVMDHIETIRSRAEYSRGSQMLTSMETFFSSAPAVAAASRKTSLLSSDEAARARTRVFSQAAAQTDEYFSKTTQEPDEVDSGAQTANIASPVDGVADSDTTPTIKSGPKISPVADELDVALEHNIKTTFETAATLIRSAADIDGITFLKLADKARALPNGAARLSRGTESDVDSQGYGDHTSTDGGPTTDTDRDERVSIAQTCSVLGSSLHVQRSPATPHIDQIPAKLLRSLLRHHPQGKVWYFDAEGEASIGDSSSDHIATKRSSDSSMRDSASRAPSRRNRRSRSKESKEIEQLFPGVRALGLVPMCDNNKNRVFAAGIIWTYSPVRILTADGDLGFLRAFSDVIMSNVARLQARMEEQAKSDFISSISHELRSPLHGILGSIDFLQEQDTVDQSIVTQIERCSITLMDVIEHLLEFSKINNLSHGTATAASKGSRVQAWLDHSTQISDRVQSLPKLTEEVADATFYSHCCNLEAKDHSNVAFILDVASEHLEEFKVPVGAWKRLCINIINNALKYTTSGHVSVSLKASHKARRRPHAVLTVTDTGCGMSRDFLEHNLFKAFAQEDSLASGTGLGMSLVAKLVRNMYGKIEVQSTKNVGTTIKVSIPTELKDASSKPPALPPLNGLRIRLPPASNDPDIIKRNDRTLQHTALERMLKVIGAESVEETPDVTLLMESDLPQSLSNDDLKQSVVSKAAIILCTSFASAATLRHSALAGALDCYIDFVPQPYGPDRMLESLRRCLLALEAQGATPYTSLTRDMDALSVVEAASSKESVSQSQDLQANTHISSLRQGQGRARFGRQLPGKLFFNTADSTGGSEDITKRADSTAVSPGSTQSILATPSTNGPTSSAPTPALEEAHANAQSQRPLSLMIVDDNRINVRILMTYADRNKHPRITASNGLEAVEAYQAATLPVEAGLDESKVTIPKPEVIFMDINMPICDGFEASRRIRAFEKSNGITPATIIALTGLGSADAHQEALTSGVDVFLTKPIRPKDLTPLLESIAHGRRENNEL